MAHNAGLGVDSGWGYVNFYIKANIIGTIFYVTFWTVFTPCPLHRINITFDLSVIFHLCVNVPLCNKYFHTHLKCASRCVWLYLSWPLAYLVSIRNEKYSIHNWNVIVFRDQKGCTIAENGPVFCLQTWCQFSTDLLVALRTVWIVWTCINHKCSETSLPRQPSISICAK